MVEEKGRQRSIELNQDTDTLKSPGLDKIHLDSTEQYDLVQTGFELYALRYNKSEQIQGDNN